MDNGLRTSHQSLRYVPLRRYLPLGLCLIGGIVLTLVSFFGVLNSEQNRVQSEFIRLASSYVAALEREINQAVEVVESIGGLYATSTNITQKQFWEFVHGPLLRHKEIRALEWIPRVADSRQKEFEDSARREFFPEFQITEQNQDGVTERAKGRKEYFPVYYVEPLQGNERAVGFDLGSNPTRLEAMEKACEGDATVATRPVKLVLETNNQYGFLLFHPVYALGLTPQTAEERRACLQGYALGVFQAGDLVESSLRGLAPGGLDFYVCDPAAPEGERLLYFHSSRMSGVTTQGEEKALSKPPAGLHWPASINFPGRQWSLLFVPTRAFLSAHASWRPWELLLGGLALTFLLGAYLYMALHRTIKMEKLLASEDRFRGLVDSTSDWIWEVDENMTYTYASPKVKDLLGYEPEEMLHKSPMQFMPPDEAERVGQLLGPLWEARKPLRMIENTNNHQDGRLVILETNGVPIFGPHGEFRGYRGIDHDITARKRAERILREKETQFLRAQRMESIGRLATGVAHDLNNILAPILMSVPMLRWGLSSREFEKVLYRIEASAVRGADVVKQLLTFGRGVEGQRGLLQVKNVLREMRKIIEETFPKSIQLTCKVAPDLWAVMGDVTQLHQVLLNLGVNAQDAMPEGGTLSLQGENVQVDESMASRNPEAKPGPHVLLTISDTGSGMPPDVLEKIFEPFFTTKPPGRGTGLGLATVLGIVKSHGGFIEVETKVGQGTTFKIFLPASPGAKAPETAVHLRKTPRGEGECLLVVDDELRFREVTREILVDAGYKVMTAEDGADALALMTTHKDQIHLVLTDLAMPILDGIALMRVLRKIAPQLKVLVSSGMANAAEFKAKYADLWTVGETQALLKPYKVEELLMAIHKLLRQKLPEPASGFSSQRLPMQEAHPAEKGGR